MRATLASFALLSLTALAGSAAAAELDTLGEGTIRETAFRYDVHVDGVVATITTRQTFTGSTATPAEAIYGFALPGDAILVGMSVTPPGGKPQRAGAVDARAAITEGNDHAGAAMVADLGLVWRLGELSEGGDVAYQLRVFPVADDGTTVELTWVAPMRYTDGRLALRIPARGDEEALAEARGTITVTPPPGVARVTDLRAGGALLAAKPGKKAWRFTAPAGELFFDLAPVLGAAPVISYSAIKLGDDTGALALTVLRPRADDAPRRFDRAVFVVDVSTSSAGTAEARDAIAGLVDGIAGGLRDDASVQAILFDRAVERVLTTPEPATAATRARLGAAVRAVAGRSGTDLLAALAEVHDFLEGRRAAGESGETLVVVLTDGLLPSDLDGASLSDALDEVPDDVTVSTVLVTPDDLPLPAVDAGPLAELSARHGGHVVAVRHMEASGRAETVAGEVAAIADWYVEGVRAGDTELSMVLPDTVPAGGGIIGFGWYRGAAPTRLSLVTSSAITAARKVKQPRLGELAIARAEPLLEADATGAGTSTQAVAALERRLGVLGSLTALVAVDRGDELAAARLDLGVRGGTFARIAPPDEGTIDAPSHEIAAIVDVGSRYEMDTAARIRVDLLQPQLVPAARRCFADALRAGGARRGRISLEIEIAGGEVVMVRGTAPSGAAPLLECIRTAAYDLAVPTYTLTAGTDTIHLIRYPIDFTASSKSDPVAVGDDDGAPPPSTSPPSTPPPPSAPSPEPGDRIRGPISSIYNLFLTPTRSADVRKFERVA